MVEAHHIGASVRRKPDEVCPFVAKIVTNENVAILGDAVDDNLENRTSREALLIIGKNALLAGRASKQRFGDKVAQEILAAADERCVAKQGAVDIGEGDVVEEDGEQILPVDVARQRHRVRIVAERERAILDTDLFYRREEQLLQRDPGDRKSTRLNSSH